MSKIKSVKKAKKDLNTIKAKYRAAKKRLLAAERNGFEKQIALQQKYVDGWKAKLKEAEEDLKFAKEAARQDKAKDGSKIKRYATYTGMSLVGSALLLAGIAIFGKKDGENSGPATDNV